MGFLYLGSEMASFTVVGLVLDYVFGTMPILTIVLTLLGVVAAFVHLKSMAASLARTKKSGPPGGEGGGP
jgi:F0F1-type ATP synthase assembly protein I